MFLFWHISKLVVERQVKHDIGYWMTVIGASTVIAGGIFGALLSVEFQKILLAVFFGVIVFGVGAEMALRNQKHKEYS